MSNLRDPFADRTSPPVARPVDRAIPGGRGSVPSRFDHVRHLALWLNTALLVLVAAGGLAIFADWRHWDISGDSRRVDARFVTLGRSYRNELAKVYARAWEEGAKNLEAGAGPAAALDGVAKAWEVGRLDLFETVVTPEFSRIVPEGKPEKELTREERARLAAAWRGFAEGLGGNR